MELGIFAKTFVRPTFEEVFAAVQDHGLNCLQFNFACAGLPTLPDRIDPLLAHRIHDELSKRAMSMAAVSGTCNLIHPDRAKRAKCLENLIVLIRSCRELGTSIVTLCTGTRDPDNMWQAHPDSQSPEAWRDLLEALERLLQIAEQAEVTLGIEPEPANVIDSAARARELLDELRSPNLRIVFDAANLLSAETLPKQQQILDEAVNLFGADIVLAHAKDLARDSGQTHVRAGRGELNYEFYLSALDHAGFEGPLILHNLIENEVDEAVAFIQNHQRRGRARPGE